MARPNRIAELRTSLDLSQKDLADRITLENGKHPTNQQISYLESGSRKLTRKWAELVASALGVEPEDLEPQGPRQSALTTPGEIGGMPAVMIPELDLAAGAADGGSVEQYIDPSSPWNQGATAPTIFEWSVPQSFADEVPTNSRASKLFIFRVVGDSMSPDFRPGDRVLVNAMDRSPSPSGAFVVFDGVSLVIKFVEVVPYSDPISVRLISANERYQSYERLLDEAHIQGRVVGRWEWT